MPDALTDLWLRSQDAISGRMAVLDQAATAMQAGALDAELRVQAEREAHKLAGLLGILGRNEGSRLAQEIEHLLGRQAGIDAPEGAALAALLGDLSRALGRRPCAPTADIEVTVGSKTSNNDCVDLRSSSRGGDNGALDPMKESRSVRSPSRRTILMIDDDDAVAKVVETALGLDGHRVVRAKNAAEGMDLALHQHFGLILLDIQMPEIDGFAACRSLRGDPALARIPIIMLSAQSDADTVKSGLAHGATDFLAKPFAISQLRARVTAWLVRAASSNC